jgi:hypothetical protein
MKVCYFDAFSGISGDMTVGALADAGADQQSIVQVLESLATGATFRFDKVTRQGIGATKFHVTLPNRKSQHRHLPGILRIIDESDAPQRAKDRAMSVFEHLGAAEAEVHQVPLESVHFHEVGAADSIADIVGACMALELLGIDEIACSSVNVGSGTVRTEHGILPVPAPATARLLQNKPVYTRGPARELTTPTGAALASALASTFGPLPEMTVYASGYGAGDSDFPEHPNVLRALLGEASLPSINETEILARITDLHGTCELLAVAGYRIGVHALQELMADRASRNLDVTLRTPLQREWSCLADGVQAATGASPGKLNLRLLEANPESQETTIVDRRSGRSLSFRLQPAFLSAYLDPPPNRRESAAREILRLPDSAIFVVKENGL